MHRKALAPMHKSELTTGGMGLFAEGILTAGTLLSAETFRFEPPATLTQAQLDQVVERTERVLRRVQTQLRSGALVDG